MESDVAGVLKETLMNSLVTMLVTSIPIKGIDIPFWIVAIVAMIIIFLLNAFTRVRS